MDDEAIIELFWARDEAAIRNTDLKYGDKLQHLAMKFLFNYEDVEESVNDTYLAAWNAIPPQKPLHLFAYLAKICRFQSYGKLDWKTSKKRQAEIMGNRLSLSCSGCIYRNCQFDEARFGE